MKVGVLFKPEVRDLNTNYIAGSERVFLKDVNHLLKANILSCAYCAARVKKTGLLKNPRIRTLFYPFFILDFFEKLAHKRLGFVSHYFSFCFHKVRFFFDLLYAAQFVFLERKADLFYVFDTPEVSIVSSRKTLLIYHNYREMQDHVLKKVFQKKNTLFVFVSRSLKRQMTSRYPSLNNCPSLVLYNGVDLRRFRLLPKSEGTFKKKIRFLYASTWTEEKGILELLGAIESVNKNHSERCEFLIAGSVDLWSLSPNELMKKKYIKERVEDMSSKYKNVKILGRISYNNLPNLYSSAHYCLLPSVYKDPFPNVVLESLACGAPAISFKKGGTIEVVRNGFNGYIVNNANAKALVNKIIEILENQSLNDYERLSKNSRKSMLEFSEAKRKKLLLSLLLETSSEISFKKYRPSKIR